MHHCKCRKLKQKRCPKGAGTKMHKCLIGIYFLKVHDCLLRITIIFKIMPFKNRLYNCWRQKMAFLYGKKYFCIPITFNSPTRIRNTVFKHARQKLKTTHFLLKLLFLDTKVQFIIKHIYC